MQCLNLLLTLVVGIGLVATASAAPDLAAIDHEREAARERLERTLRTGDIAARCDRSLTLLLDHGPRAETTPWLNQERRLRFEAQKKACIERATNGQ